MLKRTVDRLVESVLDSNPAIGIVVGVFDGESRQIFSYSNGPEDATPLPTQNTLYEIGSVTKLFTATLFAYLMTEEIVSYDSKVKNLIPALSDFPENVTLGRLATHTAGLPTLPKNIYRSLIKDRHNPYANYTANDFLDYLKSYRLKNKPKSWDRIHYSSLGMGLLGMALCDSLKLTYGEAVAAYICKPLGLRDTTTLMSEEQRKRFAQPHTARGKPTVKWDIPAMPGAGALVSTIADLLTFVEAYLNVSETGLETTFASMLQIYAESFVPSSKYEQFIGAISNRIAKRRGLRFQTEFADFQGIGLGWFLLNFPTIKAKVWFHNGATLGSRAMIAVVPESKTGVAVLTNFGMDDLSILFPKASVEEVGLGVLEFLNSS